MYQMIVRVAQCHTVRMYAGRRKVAAMHCIFVMILVIVNAIHSADWDSPSEMSHGLFSH